jgi:hypothetical protein
MAAPLSDCTIEEQCVVVCFLWAEGVKFVEIHHQMLAQYGARTMHQWKIYEWIECFKEGRTSVTDESRPGRPSTSRTDQHVQRVDALIRKDRQLTLVRTAVQLAWWRPASSADVASWETEKHLLRRDEEARWTIPEVQHCAGGLCRKVTCAFVLHQWN